MKAMHKSGVQSKKEQNCHCNFHNHSFFLICEQTHIMALSITLQVPSVQCPQTLSLANSKFHVNILVNC